VSRRSRGVPRRQWRAGLAARAVIATCLFGALLGVSLPRGGGRVATVFLVDASDSMGAGGKEAALEWVRQALADQRRDTRAGVVLFGGDARVEASLASRVRLSNAAVQIDASRTDLAGALRLAGALLPADSRRRVVLVSDGRATDGDAALEARRLKDAGIDLDLHAIAAAEGPDAAVARIDSPGSAHRGESFTLRALIASTKAGPARLTLQKDGVPVEERVVDLAVGETVVEFNQVAGDPGLSRYRVEVSAAGDTVGANDAGYAAVAVEGPAKVLIAEGTAGEGAALAAALRAGGLTVDVKKAAELPALDRLGTYSATVLVDVDAHSLSAEQIRDLSAATRDLGRGLVVLGGDHSYALGGYRDSELEALLPVISDITDPKRKQSVAEVLAIDSSGSMGACHCAEGNNGIATGGNFMGGGVNKTDIAKAGAARAVEALSATDQVGVLAFNTEQNFVIPLQQVPSKEEINKGLGKLTPAGGTDLRQPLKTAADALRAAKASLKHIVLFTDGFTAENHLDELVGQARQLAEEGITVSVLATGEGASQELKAVADAGRGRFYPGRDLSEIPQLMAQEVLLASRDFVNEGEFFPKIVGHGPAVDQLSETPSLLGYLATTAKPTAEVQLRIGAEDDPLLASWRAGLGRVTAWTSDASQRWSKNWASWGGYGQFWAAVVKDTLPLGGSEGSAVSAKVDGERLEIVAESEQPWAEGATATARIAGPNGSSQEVRLERTAGGRFVGEIDATAPGSYSVGVSVDGPTGRLASGVALASQSYSPEYRPGPAEPEELARLSQLSGGRGPIEAAAAFDVDSLAKGHGRRTLTGWLLLLATLLWPLDCALRRLSLTAVAPMTLAAKVGSNVKARLPGLDRLPRVDRLPQGMRTPRPNPPKSTAPPAPPAETPPKVPSEAPEPATPPEQPEPTPVGSASPETSDTLGRLLQRKRSGGR
jgi:Mg-chelatase subunit ChlD